MDYTTEKLIEKYKSEMQKMISTQSVANDSAEQNSPNSLTDKSLSEQFPGFENQNGSLKEKIEEILRQNSEVANPDDYPNDEQVTSRSEPRIENGEKNNLGQEAEPNNVIEKSVEISDQNSLGIQVQLTASENNNTPAQQEVVSRTCIRGGQKAQYSPPANTGSSRDNNQDPPELLTDIGFLKIETFSANRAFPVKNAVVRVKNAVNDSLIGVFVTDTDGLTEFFELATPDRNLSQSAIYQNPFSNYLVDVSAEGYAPVNNLNVQMFGGVQSVLPVNLIPQIKR